MRDIISPVKGVFDVTRGLGYFGDGYHDAVDIACPIGTQCVAIKDGIVKFAGFLRDLNGAQGKTGEAICLIIDHYDGTSSGYFHLSKVLDLWANNKVKQGDVVALSGNTGQSTGPHLHFTYRINNKNVDYRDYLMRDIPDSKPIIVDSSKEEVNKLNKLLAEKELQLNEKNYLINTLSESVNVKYEEIVKLTNELQRKEQELQTAQSLANMQSAKIEPLNTQIAQLTERNLNLQSALDLALKERDEAKSVLIESKKVVPDKWEIKFMNWWKSLNPRLTYYMPYVTGILGGLYSIVIADNDTPITIMAVVSYIIGVIKLLQGIDGTADKQKQEEVLIRLKELSK